MHARIRAIPSCNCTSPGCSWQAQQATAAYRELLTRNADTRIWQQAGTTLVRAGQYQLARDFLTRAVADIPKALLDFAIALLSVEGPQQALDAIDQMPEAERDGDYLLMKAHILDVAGRSAEVEKILQEGLRRSFSRPDVAQQTALLLFRHNHPAEALSALDQAAKADPDNPDLLLEQAILLALTDNTPTAEQTLKQIESRWPEWDRAYLVHGLLFEHVKRTGAARQKLQTAIALGSGDLVARCALARLGGQPSPSPQCACARGLRELVFPMCGEAAPRSPRSVGQPDD
jgi:tetratricopeptide (TPR) repeat protein